MSECLQKTGEKLISEAERILVRDVKGALDEGDANLAVRRSQEVVELALKGALKILGIDYPRIHDVAPVFSEQIRQKRQIDDIEALDRIETASLWLTQARAPAFYFERDYNIEDAQQAFQDADFVLNQVRRMLRLSDQQPEKGAPSSGDPGNGQNDQGTVSQQPD